ncbi:hypothetical protein ACFQZT_11130 [Paenibacillus sp. GCM10027628]|uniref:hypothetical protein n=1 Tax=Paenibacillus sp. GCM10027628 TaxID=3273413 RepID=UPI003639C9AE
MQRLQKIIMAFPNQRRCEHEWYQIFRALIIDIQSCRSGLQPGLAPEGMLPVTSFQNGGVHFPSILLKTAASEEVISEPAIATPNPNVIEIGELYTRLKGHLIDLDHSGINLPVSLCPKSEWDSLECRLARFTNIYGYPGEDWPFIIPAAEQEFVHEITDFSVIRTPKFEWVYDSYATLPILQFALVTDVSRQELEELFPAPAGFAIPGLADIFRSVLIDSPWRDKVVFRMDLYYKRTDGIPSDWETGEWLVKEGGRIRPA